MPLLFDQHIPLTATHDVMKASDSVVVLLHVLKLYRTNAFNPAVPNAKNGQ